MGDCPKCGWAEPFSYIDLKKIKYKCRNTTECGHVWEVERKHESTTDNGWSLPCPACGYEITDLFEFGDGGRYDCPECDATLDIDVYTTIEYTATVME